MKTFEQLIDDYLDYHFNTDRQRAAPEELYKAVSMAAVRELSPRWTREPGRKRACYFSAEFLVGRLVYSNLLNLGLLDRAKTCLAESGRDLSLFEEVEDNALGNGGLGRLAACFLDSGATHGVPLDGFGIRYRYGLFRQSFENGFQKENPDDWQRFGDPWSIRREEESVPVRFADQTVRAVPYDMPVIGWGGRHINTLRLWQSEALNALDFAAFNEQKYGEAFRERDLAEAVTAVLYPNDDTREGKRLRLKQQYFFASASLQSLLREFGRSGEGDVSRFAEHYAIQLNDTHPVVAIPELLRLLIEEHGLTFDQAFSIAQKCFAYTNHTIMAEALEKWEVSLFAETLPDVYAYVVMLNNALCRELSARGVERAAWEKYLILQGGQVHMARLAIFAGHCVNGVAELHTRILRESALREWHELYPERFQNKTNGVTQRRWLRLCNPELSGLISRRIGEGWITNLDELKGLEPMVNDSRLIEDFQRVKWEKKRQLAEYIREKEGVALNPDWIFDVQIKRLHEYKRQLLNALGILDLYFGIKDGRIRDFHPTVFLFGAKAAPGYYRAKAVIKLINEIAGLVNSDPATKDLMQVLFVQNYNVSCAERLIPAADVSEQISTAGTEASGTGNMKLMLNGAVTLGTMDGANIEIVEQAGEQNNYIFGARLEELSRAAEGYDPRVLYKSEPRIHRAVNALVDGTLRDGDTGMFSALYHCLLNPTYNKADHYFVLYDFISYCETRLRLNRDYRNRWDFTRKCLMNTTNAGKFSSDRTVRQYAREIWGL